MLFSYWNNDYDDSDDDDISAPHEITVFACDIHFVTHPFSFVMKLFDRSVDFAQFNEDTPLYALARAWMQNKPYGTKSTDFQESGILDGDPLSSSQENIVSINHSVGWLINVYCLLITLTCSPKAEYCEGCSRSSTGSAECM